MKLGVITNPNSKKNRNQPMRAADLREVVGEQGLVRQTSGVEEIKDVLREFIRDGATHWVSDGGDGALHWMLNQAQDVLEEDEFKKVHWPLAVPTNGGTIDFVAKKAGIKGNAVSILRRLIATSQAGEVLPTVEIDTFVVEGEQVTEEGLKPFRRIGFAAAIAGVGQQVLDQYYREDPVPGPPTIAKVIGKAVGSHIFDSTPLSMMVPSLTDYGRRIFSSFPAKVVVDGYELPYRDYGAINVGSIDINLGGVVRTFGLAKPLGKLHIQAGAIKPKDMILNLYNMYKGRNIVSKELYDEPGETMEVYPLDGQLLDPVIDGEFFRGLKYARVKLGPRVRVPKVAA